MYVVSSTKKRSARGEWATKVSENTVIMEGERRRNGVEHETNTPLI